MDNLKHYSDSLSANHSESEFSFATSNVVTPDNFPPPFSVVDVLRPKVALNIPEFAEEYYKRVASQKIEYYIACMADIELCERLHKFGDIGNFDRSFFDELDWLLETWIDESEELFDSRKVSDIEDRLERLPFEDALECKHSGDQELINKCVEEWRTNVCTVMTMSKEDKIRIHGYFEYMCYFVINAREELLYEIANRLGE